MILGKMGLKTIVVDQTKEQEIMTCVTRSEEFHGIIQYSHADFTGRTEEILQFQQYDIQFVAYSFEQESLPDSILDGVILVSDFRKKHIESVAEMIQTYEGRKQIILRDVLDKKLGRDYFLRAYADLSVEEEQVFELAFDELDYFYRIRMEHEPIGRLKELSEPYCNLLLRFASDLSELPLKEVKCSFRKLRGGNIY
jgi:hypothetical protein